MVNRTLIFLLINFAGLALGSLVTSSAVDSEWYQQLNKAPWTPPGWVFGFAWTSIMICFSIFLGRLWPKLVHKKNFVVFYISALIYNALWNYLFFYWQWPLLALLDILGLTILITLIFIEGFKENRVLSLLLAPYLLWLLIATSLNAYIVIFN